MMRLTAVVSERTADSSAGLGSLRLVCACLRARLTINPRDGLGLSEPADLHDRG